MSEPIPKLPEANGEPEGVEVNYELAFDPETNEAKIIVAGQGMHMMTIITPEGYGNVELMSAAFAEAVPTLLEQILEHAESKEES